MLYYKFYWSHVGIKSNVLNPSKSYQNMSSERTKLLRQLLMFCRQFYGHYFMGVLFHKHPIPVLFLNRSPMFEDRDSTTTLSLFYLLQFAAWGIVTSSVVSSCSDTGQTSILISCTLFWMISWDFTCSPRFSNQHVQSILAFGAVLYEYWNMHLLLKWCPNWPMLARTCDGQIALIVQTTDQTY